MAFRGIPASREQELMAYSGHGLDPEAGQQQPSFFNACCSSAFSCFGGSSRAVSSRPSYHPMEVPVPPPSYQYPDQHLVAGGGSGSGSPSRQTASSAIPARGRLAIIGGLSTAILAGLFTLAAVCFRKTPSSVTTPSPAAYISTSDSEWPGYPMPVAFVPTTPAFMLTTIAPPVLPVPAVPSISMTTEATTTTTSATATTTTTTTALRSSSCLIYGDPLLKTFDGGRPSIYGEGDFWIMRSSDVKIQGRYMGSKTTENLASTHKVSLSGSALHDHVLEVEPYESGAILFDGSEVLMTFGNFSFEGGFVKFNDQGDPIDKDTKDLPKRVVHVDLPENISVTIFRWSDHLDLNITAPPMSTDGACGNFNGDPEDDTTEDIFHRVGARVAHHETKISGKAKITFSSVEQEMLATQCSAQKKSSAKSACKSELKGDVSEDEMNNCIFDHCFGADDHALQAAKQLAKA